VDADKYIYPVDPSLKNPEFIEKHKQALIFILMENYKLYQANNYKLSMPQSIKERTEKYIQNSCEFFSWFKEEYEFTGNKKDYITCKTIWEDFQGSEFYMNLSRLDKRDKYRKKHITDFFKKNILIRKNFRNRIQPIVNGTQVDLNNVIINYKIKAPVNDFPA